MMGILREFARRPSALFGLFVVSLVLICAIAAPLIAPFSPNEQLFDGLTLEGAPVPPDATYLLGTDTLGRDLLSRLLFGARTEIQRAAERIAPALSQDLRAGAIEFPGREAAPLGGEKGGELLDLFLRGGAGQHASEGQLHAVLHGAPLQRKRPPQCLRSLYKYGVIE